MLLVLPRFDALPAIVPVGRFLIRTQYLVVALSHVAVYPGGCMLEVQVSGKAGGDGPQMHSSDAIDQLVFVVRFGAEITAVMDGHHLARNSGPLQLSQLGGETGASARRADSSGTLWLHPLPPPQAGTLSILAPDLGPRLTACPVDGRAIGAAAQHVQPYWS